MVHDADYVLGTDAGEIARLGLQHQVWRSHMLDAWHRAGLKRGSRIVDIGSGPGYAAVDAADIVGPSGQVLAIERSGAFAEFSRDLAERRNIPWVRVVERDIVDDDIDCAEFDLAWCRWVASFVRNPGRLLGQIGRLLRSGGKVVFHEYQNYATWRTIPASPRLQDFVGEVMASWRSAGGEPDVASVLVSSLVGHGFRAVELRPLVFCVRPADFMWEWPAAFIQTGSERLVELDRVTDRWAREIQSEFAALSADPNAVMMTPTVLEIIAEKI